MRRGMSKKYGRWLATKHGKAFFVFLRRRFGWAPVRSCLALLASAAAEDDGQKERAWGHRLKTQGNLRENLLFVVVLMRVDLLDRKVVLAGEVFSLLTLLSHRIVLITFRIASTGERASGRKTSECEKRACWYFSRCRPLPQLAWQA